MIYKPRTIFINLANEEFEKLQTVKQYDRVIFLDNKSDKCFIVYNLVDDNEQGVKKNEID